MLKTNVQKLLSVIVAIEKGPTRSYRLGLSLSYLISITDIADCGWPRREYNYYNGHLFKQGRHSLSKGSR